MTGAARELDCDIAVVVGGIIGLATARALRQRFPRHSLVVLEKEARIAAHQTGHNSGVIHSGIYYRPDSHKAKLCVRGAKQLVQYCLEHDIQHELCGKVVVAVDEEEIPRLRVLSERGLANGVQGLRMLDRAGLRELEPHAQGVGGLHSPATGIVDFSDVAAAYKRDVQETGAEIRTATEVRASRSSGGLHTIETNQGPMRATYLINCAGLHSDVIARMAGAALDLRIIAFRGEYYTLQPDRQYLVRNLIYPVPDPRFPFLGVHFTRTVHSGVEAGPNAVLALAREGYSWGHIDLRSTLGMLRFPGFWRMAGKYWRTGMQEVYRSMAKAAFVRSLQRLVPDVQASDLARGGSGVRAQAVDSQGNLLDDFRIVTTSNAVHVLNAPSPAATASLAIADHIVAEVGDRLGLTA